MSEHDLLPPESLRPGRPGDVPAVLVIMGVSGSGKSTLARQLSTETGWDLQEGDDLHAQANVEKMAAGLPLTDEDRWPWLQLISEWIDTHRHEGRHGVVTCSALKRSYRDMLARPDVAFIHLAPTYAEIAARLMKREGHFMPAALLDSQFEALEPLEADERGIVVGGSASAQLEEILTRLGCR